MAKTSVNKNILFSLWWKVFLELISLIILFFIIDRLVWWAMIGLGEFFWGCELYDAGLFKSPGVDCDSNIFMASFVEKIMQAYSMHTMPVFFLLMFFILGFYISIPVIALTSLIPAVLIYKSLKKSLGDRTKIFKFPVLTRLLFKKLARLLNKRKKKF